MITQAIMQFYLIITGSNYFSTNRVSELGKWRGSRKCRPEGPSDGSALGSAEY